jgi:hypothetical protein
MSFIRRAGMTQSPLARASPPISSWGHRLAFNQHDIFRHYPELHTET